MLSKIDTKAPDYSKKEEIKKENEQLLEKIIDYQKKMNAEAKHSILIVLQGMDAAGKSGAARVLAGVNPSGIRVKGYKKPTEHEMAHDFLWRIHQHTPARGMIQIFDRSHYEDILVPTVGKYLPKDVIDKRYDLINDFERLLTQNNTTILKFYLHLSKDKQEERLMERVNNPQKHYKHNDGDWKSREDWDDYMKVYECIFKKCDEVPWKIIPSDNGWYKENLIAKEIIAAFEKMDMKWPKLQSEIFTK